MGLWFGLFLLAFLIIAALVWFQVALFSPEVWLVLISSLAFGLFAFKLMSTFTFVMTTADHYRKTGGEIRDRGELSDKSGKTQKEIEEMPLSALLALILGALSPYKYAFYLAFTLVLLFTLAFGFLPGFDPVKVYTEALFWGAAITTFIVWAFDNFAEAAVEELAEYELKQTEGEGEGENS